MRWDDSHESPDLIDRRGEGPAARGGGGLGAILYFLPWLLRTRYGWVVLVLVALFFVGRAVLWSGDAGQRAHGGALGGGQAAETPETHFVSFVLDDVQGSWEKEFAASGRPPYRHAKLVLFTDSTDTGCGYGESATGPFYCPMDERVYLDLGFFHELSGELGARGQFAQAYVVAHEIGHHVQKLLGIRGDDTSRGAQGASVRLELQADCYAGVWAHSTEQRNILEAGDVESAINAAQAIGDDRLQRMSTGTVSPEKWTHGSSAERARWFRRGLDEGTVAACDTFSARTL
jgi:predicted metalloprotease